jgi:hypothetical protein
MRRRHAVRRRPRPPPLLTERTSSCAPPLDPYSRPAVPHLRATPRLTLAVVQHRRRRGSRAATPRASPLRHLRHASRPCPRSPARLLLRIFAIRLGVDRDEPSHDAILPIPRRGPAPPWAPSRTPTSPRTTTIKASSSTTSGSHRASPTRPRASRPRRVPSRVRVELQQVLADVRVLAARPQRAARAYSVRVGQG